MPQSLEFWEKFTETAEDELRSADTDSAKRIAVGAYIRHLNHLIELLDKESERASQGDTWNFDAIIRNLALLAEECESHLKALDLGQPMILPKALNRAELRRCVATLTHKNNLAAPPGRDLRRADAA